MLINLLKLSYAEFEDLICDLYQHEGFAIEFRSGVGPDGMRDLMISKKYEDSLTSIIRKYVVQCKRYKATVGQAQVKDIVDTIERYGAQGFILAVTSRVSQPLLNKMADLKSEKDYVCLPLLPSEITDKIVKYPDVFIKYFPAEYNKYVSATSSLEKQDVIDYLNQLEDIKLDSSEVEIIRKDLVLFNVRNLNTFKKQMANAELSTLIHKVFSERLDRKPSFTEYCHYVLYLSSHEKKYWQALLDVKLMSSSEFISKARIVMNFYGLPKADIQFDEVHQGAFYFSTYHHKHKIGRLRVIGSDVPAHLRAVQISSITQDEFRVICLDKTPLPLKKILSVDYKIDGFFQLFIRVIGEDKKLYYIQYIDGQGENNVIDNRGSIYVQIYNTGIAIGPDMLRKELNFSDDLHRICGTRPAEISALFIGVKGILTVYEILIV